MFKWVSHVHVQNTHQANPYYYWSISRDNTESMSTDNFNCLSHTIADQHQPLWIMKMIVVQFLHAIAFKYAEPFAMFCNLLT